MFNNITNFLNLIRGRKIKTAVTIENTDLIPLGTKDPNFLGGYQPTAIEFDELKANIIASVPPPPPSGVQSVTDNGAGVISVNNADPLNPVVSYTGIFKDGTLTGTGQFGNPLSVVPQQAYTTVKDESTVLPQRSTMAFVGAGVTAIDNGTTTVVTIPGGGVVNYGNVFFVDSTNGNDATAVRNDFTKPYLSAYTAGAAATLTSPTSTNRALVYVRAGTYTNNFIILFNNVDTYCEPGVVFENVIVQDNGASISCKFFGKAVFRGTVPAFSNELFRLTGSTSNVYFEFDDLFSNRAAVGVYSNSSATIVGRKIFAETFNAGYGITVRTTGTVTINVTEEIAAWHQVFGVRAFSGKMYVTCPRMYLHEGNYYGADFKMVIAIRDSLGGEVVLNGDLIMNPVAGYYGSISGVITRWTDSWGTLRVNGNIYAENQFGVYGLGSSAASRTIINGDVRSNNLIAYTASNSSVVFRNGTLMNWNTYTGSEGYPVLSVGGNGKYFVDNCQMYSLGVGATYPNIAAFWKDTITSEINVYNTTHSGSDASGFFVRNSAPGQPVNNVRIHNCRSSKPNDTNITDLLSPTGFIQDPNTLALNFI